MDNPVGLGKSLKVKTPTSWDAVTVLKGFVIVQYVIPSDQRILALGAAGSPAILYALGALLWWVWHRIRYTAPMRTIRARMLRAMLYCFLAAMIASYAAANVTALPASESNMADMGAIKIVAMVGLVLVASDGIPNIQRLMSFVRFLSAVGALYASLGLFQFFTGISVINLISIPGLSSVGGAGVDERGGFVRAVATAMHPLEYATVLSMLLPLCLTLAVFDRRTAGLVRWFPVVVITICSTLSVSRSALIGAAAVFVILIPSWPRAFRHGIGIMLVFGFATMYVAVPGMAGTILGLFSGSDTSVSSRTGSYDAASEFLAVSPFFGRGLGTFLPAYHIFDNQYLLLVIETGILGLVSFLVLLLVTMYGVLRSRVEFSDVVVRGLGMAIFAALVAGALLSAFFDSLSFPQAGSLIFLMIGIAGAYASLAAPAPGPLQKVVTLWQGRGQTGG
ncbi:O-antigen ligase family protein [Paeniglutamicibacter sp.]|uniref:O-antigen ligase family protein n=1 Tax=Paeniglutamicibacter sp. TaxID=1934391 RepID=UPI003988A792